MEANTQEAALLQWYVDIGVDEFIGEEPVNRLSEPAPSPVLNNVSPLSKVPSPATMAPASGTVEALKEAKAIAAKVTTIEELKKAMAEFEGIALRRTAIQMVLAEGVVESKVMLIGDTPGANEDRAGRPFVGDAGALLDKMLGAIDRNRDENIYLSYLVPWYPPGNRMPTDSEIALCLPFIEKHIELVQPKLIICLGDIATKTLLKTRQSVTRIQGEWQEYKTENMETPIPTIPLFRPEYLINTPKQKAKAWECLQEIQKKIETLD